MSQGWKDGYWELFKCPLCGSRKYIKVVVQRPGGMWYTTPFYECFHCSVMFRNPQQFAKCSSEPGPPAGGIYSFGANIRFDSKDPTDEGGDGG